MQSQELKPKLLLSGSLNFNQSYFEQLNSDYTATRTIIGISPSLIKVKSKKLHRGYFMNYSLDRYAQRNQSTSINYQSQFSIGVFARYFFRPENKLQFFVKPQISLGSSYDYISQNIFNNWDANFNAAFGLGIRYPVSDKFFILLQNNVANFNTYLEFKDGMVSEIQASINLRSSLTFWGVGVEYQLRK